MLTTAADLLFTLLPSKVPISPLLWLFKRDRIWGAKFFIAPLLYIEEEQVWLGDDSHLHLKCGCHRQEERIDE